jgi:nucleotide-binding universal stress UspA family protein
VNYKTIVVHVDAGPDAPARIRLAIDQAQRAGAHLVGAASTGGSRFVTPNLIAGADVRFAARCAALHAEAAEALRTFERLAREAGLDAAETRLVDDDVDGGMAMQARYCDLAVVGQSGGAPAPDRRDDLPDYLFLTSARPVLVVPHVHRDWRLDGAALVAWDGSVEATRAVTGALPLLRAARCVTVVGFGAAGERPDDTDPCAHLAAWLARHGVAASAGRRAESGDVGEALLSAAADMDADLLVMGGYGHARYRELLLGGVTATVLRALTLPVLLAH